MLAIPEKLKGISHPLISSMYLKKEYGQNDYPEDVLVIETNFHEETEDYKDYDLYLTRILADLNRLQAQAEKNIGKIDRIDIRS